MKIKYLLVSVLCLAMIALAGCGSNSSNDNPAPITTPAPALSTTINGLASFGPINGGTVKVFAIKNGVVDESTVLATGTTDANGKFTVAGNFTGPVEVEITGGSFTDETTGQVVNVNTTTELRAMVSNVTGTMPVAVTALTQLAAEKAATDGMTPAAIDTANAKMSSMFQMGDIISALPDPNGTVDQKKHAAANKVISGVVNKRKHSGESTSDALQRVMGDLGTEVSHNGGFSDDTLAEIETEVESEHGAITTISHPSGKLKISAAGGTGIGALDMTLTLPAGVTVGADANGDAAANVNISGAAAAAGTGLIAAKVSGSSMTISMTNTAGFGSGECVAINFNVAPGAAFPTKASFVTNVTGAKATNGTTAITGVTASATTVMADL